MENEETQKLLQDLHRLLLETHVIEGKLVCGNCGHEYEIKEGIANFLLPGHLGKSYWGFIGSSCLKVVSCGRPTEKVMDGWMVTSETR